MNFKLLKETRTITTLWAVPQDARIEDMNTCILYEYCLDHVTQHGIKMYMPKVQVTFNKTLELEELTAQEQQETTFYPEPAIKNPTRFDILLESMETLLIQNGDETDINISIEKLELLKKRIDDRIAKLIE